MATTVSFGRNTAGGEQLPDKMWEAFTLGVGDAVADECEEVYFVGQGGGQYQGVPEVAFTIVASDPDDRLRLAEKLKVLARRFGQESIALTVGPTELVSP